MHDTAMDTGGRFFKHYVAPQGARVLDVGAMDINGSLRSVAPAGADYVGVDMAQGPGVDIVLADPHVLPFPDGSFSAIVSTSCYEHDGMFWLSFLEALRVVEDGGYVYISSPSNGWYHRHPRDCWRFYPDCGLSLVDWAQRQGIAAQLVESFTARRVNDYWNDAVMVFCKGEERATKPRISDDLPGAMNIRQAGNIEAVLNQSDSTEDMQIIQTLIAAIRQRNQVIAELKQMLADCHTAIGAHVARLNDAQPAAA